MYPPFTERGKETILKAKPHVVQDVGGIQSVCPEFLHELFEKCFNEGDLDRIARLYEPDAALVDRDGTIVSGKSSIVEYIRGLLSLKPTIRIEHIHTIEAGDVAVLMSEWKMSGTAPDGSTISDGGHTYDIVRRQSDGTWKVVVDNPWGTVLPDLGEETKVPRKH